MQKQGHADTHSHAVDRRDNWRLRRRDRFDELCRGDRAGFLQEAVEVVACGETVAAAGDVDDTNIVFTVSVLDCLAQGVVHGWRERVFLLRPVDLQAQDLVISCDQNVLHSHNLSQALLVPFKLYPEALQLAEAAGHNGDAPGRAGAHCRRCAAFPRHSQGSIEPSSASHPNHCTSQDACLPRTSR